MVFGNRVMRTIGPKIEQMKGGWRKLHNEELCNFSSRYIIRVIIARNIETDGACSTH